jgi:23S rRNA pseudouridine2457 synthase
MLSQFKGSLDQRLLGALDFPFPEGTMALGRLDFESEGLLILTTEKSLKRKLFHPDKLHEREYLVQVAGKVSEETLKKLREGIEIILKKTGPYITLACEVTISERPHWLKSFDHNMKPFIPHSWLRFVLHEGKNRQIRKMCRIVHHKCVRLVRTRIADTQLADLQPGEVREISGEKLYQALGLS